MHTGTSEARRVAVVVVHGVADQRPGETASSVVELLVASAPAGTRYEAIGSEAYVLNVAPLAPAIANARANDPTPSGKGRPLFKALVQSGRSDFQRRAGKRPSRWPRREVRRGRPARKARRCAAVRLPRRRVRGIWVDETR